MAIKFVVYGEPVPQGRPRATLIPGKKGSNDAGHIRMYDPASSRHYKDYVRAEALKVRPPALLGGPLSLSVRAYRSIPASWSLKKRAQALSGEIRPVTKPDLKNILAGVEDALKGIVWRDDSQVVDFGDSGKWYSDAPRVEVEIKTNKEDK